MSFTDPGFEEMSFNELKDWLAGNDLSSASYAELLDQLGVDLPTALPGVVQSSLGGSSGSVSLPYQGSTLVWDSTQQIYVPGMPEISQIGGVAYGVATLTWPGGTTYSNELDVSHGLAVKPTAVLVTAVGTAEYDALICAAFWTASYVALTAAFTSYEPASGATYKVSWLAIV